MLLNKTRADDSPEPTDFKRARKFHPLSHLTDGEYQDVMKTSEFISCRAGGNMFSGARNDRWLYYLIAGEVAIFDNDGGSYPLRRNSAESLHPPTPDVNLRTTARAKSSIRYLRVSATLLNSDTVGDHGVNADEGISVNEITEENDDTIDNRIIFSVYHELAEQSLVLPTLPDVALRIREAVKNDENGPDDITRIVQTDPSIAAYCTNVANSAAYASVAKTD